ncbi:MAG: gliding motility-associated C-terminal domain-containing protein, partial [Saprospiraceae bacterium]|nr:gliding motility-associated C-terminal domain-containing protein [Saprospiraceae bacterium]
WLPSEGLSCDDCLNPVISPTSNTAYQVIIRTQEECETTGNVTILVDKDARVYIPNAFSPNSDGINDVFMIYAADNNVSKIKSFLGFNRWGETVFEFRDFDPNDPKFGWNGKFRGEKMNAQVLVWFAEIEFIDGSVEVFKGDVILIR